MARGGPPARHGGGQASGLSAEQTAAVARLAQDGRSIDEAVLALVFTGWEVTRAEALLRSGAQLTVSCSGRGGPRIFE